MTKICCLTVCALLFSASAARAQYWLNGGPSTAAQSYAAGYADVIRAAGDAEVSDSVAAGNYAAARSQEIDNHKKAVETYFQLKEVNKRETAKIEGPPLTQEQLYLWNKSMAPKRPNTAMLDPVTGKIAWPIILRTNLYAAPCHTLDGLFSERASTGSLNGDQYAAVQDSYNTILSTLTANASKYSDMDIIAVKKLIDALLYEARFPAG
jgi:hypothetical protein